MKRTYFILIVGFFIGLITSQSGMDLFMTLITLVCLFAIIKEKDFNWLSTVPKWFYLSFVWFLWVFATRWFIDPTSLAPFEGLSFFGWILQLPLLLFLWHKLGPGVSLARTALWVLCMGALFAVSVYCLGFDPLHQTWADRPHNLEGLWRSGGFFSNPMALAQSYGPLAALLMPLTLKSLTQKNQFRNLTVVTFVLVILAVLFTLTRGIWLALSIATLIGGFLYQRRWGFFALSLILVSGITLLSSWPAFRERAFQAFNPQKSYDTERLILWKANWAMFMDYPITGIGYEENRHRLREYYDRMGVPKGQFESHAHNQYLHFLAGTGLIGLLFYLIICFQFLKLSFQLFKQTRYQPECETFNLMCLGLLMFQITFHLGSMTEANFSIAKNRMLLVLVWSFTLYLRALSHSHRDRNKSNATFSLKTATMEP